MEGGWEGLRICHAFMDSIAFKQEIFGCGVCVVTKLVIFCRSHKCMTPIMVIFNRPEHFKFFKGFIPQILLDTFLNTFLIHMNSRNMVMY